MSLLLAGVALMLFLTSRGAHGERAAVPLAAVGPIDREVDSLLARFGVERRTIRRTEFPIPNTALTRVERRVVIPRSALAIQMNVAFSAMARQYNGRAVASENLKEGTVTIHVEVGGYVIETIVLKPERHSGRQERRSTAARFRLWHRGAPAHEGVVFT